MTRDTRPGLLSAASYSQVSRTCDDRRVSTGGGGSLLRISLILCCVTVICGKPKDRISRGIEDLQLAMSNSYQLGYCDVEKTCDWSWNQTSGFKRISPNFKDPEALHIPPKDASKSRTGHFLWFGGKGKAHIWSTPIPRTDTHCLLELWLYQMEMSTGFISLLIESNNLTTVSVSKSGNNLTSWEKMHFNLGLTVGQPINKLILEVNTSSNKSSIAIDNIRLVNCFSEFVICSHDTFRCNDSYCLNRTRVCDLTKDCENGEDEAYECDKIPGNARCDFEYDWCGWTNVRGRPLDWTRHKGPTTSERTGPDSDHTYRNETGTYAYVNMAKRAKYGSRGTIDSPLYNPTPPYSSDPKSPYYKSCQIRFFYHHYGVHSALFALYLVQIMSNTNQSDQLWSSFGDKGDVWNNVAVALPEIKYRYFFQFEASKGLSTKGDVAIDDISLSPECFGIGVPPDVIGDFNYYEPIIDFEIKPSKHSDFTNETAIRISTCGATGRTGPIFEQCIEQNNKTDVELIVPLSTSDQENIAIFHLEGIQRWTAPRGEYYTLIGAGARGGKGSTGKGITLGALVRGVIELQKGDQLYFMVGQEGIDACLKNLGLSVDSCQSPGGQSNESSVLHGSSSTSSKVREVKNMEFKDGGGGGGGATAVFTLKANGELEPILIAGGGGGLGLGQFVNDGAQHGRGPAPMQKLPFLPFEASEDGHGASWSGMWSKSSNRKDAAATPLIHGGVGGFGCESGNKSYGNGGFGGGGGGCQTGGGGGGYIGGNSRREGSGNGEGGYSYASQRLINIYFKPAAHNGPGEILIIPAISGCGCDYRCVALDEYLNETKCLCPQGWELSNDSKSCIMTQDPRGIHQTYMIPLIVVSSLLFIIGIVLIYYFSTDKRCQNQNTFLHQDTELTALHTVNTMMTEFNPNYEFAGNLYSFKDLPQILREYITLVKPLGQGAFGEVFQGVYKFRRGEEHPVAVKTLPSLSTTQAEADFMMEALIMSKFDHPNIVHFIGVSFDKHPRYIILELLAGGDLKNFLREERPRPDRPTCLTMQDLVMCGYDVANGCKYMEQARFIHRDIAARNCLLTTKGPGRAVKIADFGMARDIYRSDYYKKGGKAMLPIKWMPPESFMDGIFTTKTDVWAFGVLLWEIMSFGYMPYTGCANREVMTMVRLGGRLEKPAGCPDPIYGIMTRCWHPQPDDRPSFSTIAERISYCLQDPDVINHPMPNFDILPVCDREITIMRPDPEAECINVKPDLDKGYEQPRIIDPRLVAHHMGQARLLGGTIYNPKKPKLNRGDEVCETFVRPTERQQIFCSNACDSSTDTFEQTDSGDHDDRDDDITEDCEIRPWTDRLNRQDARTIHRNDNIEDHDNRRNADNGNNRPEEEDCHLTANSESAITDRRNGNESTTTTDTNSDSLIVQSSDTPPDTTTNSSPNTRTCSPNRITGFNNGVIKKNTLKATLSLDPSALCRGTIPYEKITRAQRSSTPGSMDLRKDSLSRELPREEECSC